MGEPRRAGRPRHGRRPRNRRRRSPSGSPTDGASVVVNDVDEDVARAAAAGDPGSVDAVGSVADSARRPTRWSPMAEREFGALDLVVNNAGITRDAMLHRMTDASWDLGARRQPAAARSTSAARRRGCCAAGRRRYNRKVVNIASINGIYGVAGNANYSAAKAGVIGLTKSLAREWAPPADQRQRRRARLHRGTRLTAARQRGRRSSASRPT